VSSTTGGLLSHTGHATTGVLDGTVNIVGGVTGSIGAGGALDLDVPGLHEATSSVIGSLPGSDTVGGLLPDLSHEDSTATHVDHHATGVTDVLGGVTHAAEPDAGHDVLGGLTGLHF
jgi:hypothetical protein